MKEFFNNQRGGIELILIPIIILFGVFLSGGFRFPGTLSSIDQGGEYMLITPEPGKEEKSLQLKTLEFKDCSETMAMDFLLDRSNSMNSYGKIDKLKDGMLTFASKLSDKSVIGIQDFSSVEHERGIVSVLVPFTYYGEIKEEFPSLISKLRAGGNTNTHTALRFSIDKIKQGQTKFPDHEFAFLFLSDGEPRPQGVFPNGQEPTEELINELKSLDIRIFTIAYMGPGDNGIELLRRIASSPEDAYVAPNPEQIDEILDEISVKLCE